LLVNNGAQNTKDIDGRSPLMKAAINDWSSIVEYLISQTSICSTSECIEALELLGVARSIQDLQTEAFHYLFRAMKMRFEDQSAPPIHKMVLAPVKAYANHVECQTIDELERLWHNLDALRMETLVVMERLLGTKSAVLYDGLHQIGHFYLIEADFVFNEIKKSITSAQECNPIVYTYGTITTDYRFNVTNLEEYYETLNLGKLAVGNRLLSVTPYLPSSKLTYCSKCYTLGHTSLNCNSHHPKCRVCLGEFTNNHRNECEGQFKCAQCGGNNFSLDENYPMVQKHRQGLNKEVKHVVRNDDLNYNTQLKQIKKSNEHQYAENAFPPLVKMDRSIVNR
ncbi:unnamed protein product, partial [Didymodactylos carnosus]